MNQLEPPSVLSLRPAPFCMLHFSGYIKRLAFLSCSTDSFLAVPNLTAQGTHNKFDAGDQGFRGGLKPGGSPSLSWVQDAQKFPNLTRARQVQHRLIAPVLDVHLTWRGRGLSWAGACSWLSRGPRFWGVLER